MFESSQVPGRRTGGPAPRRRRAGSRPSVIAGAVAVLVTLFATVLSAPAAWAHDELLDLQPGNKVVLSTPPTQVQLVFGAPALKVGSQIRVTGPDGRVVSTGPLAIDGGTVVEKLVTGLTDGQYRVDWRVTSSDGHPVSGTYTFSIKAAAPTATASPSAPVTATGPAPTASGPTSPTPTASAPAAGGGGSGSSGSGTSAGLVAGIAAVVALLAAAAFTLVRRRNGGASTRTEGNPHS